MRIFHIATVPDWEDARSTGSYTTSTRGRTLAEEGFIHASRGDQWQGVRARFYADVTEPLLLLVIDTERLTSPVVDEAVPDSTETFPHVYGPIDLDAVVQTIELAPVPAPVAASTAPAPVDQAPDDQAPVDQAPIDQAPVDPGPSFSRLYLQEMFRNVLMASIVLAVVVAATLAGVAVRDQWDWGPITGALVGLVIGVLVVRRLFRRGTAA